MNKEQIYKELYNAFLLAIEQTGDDYKKLSWFIKNKVKEYR